MKARWISSLILSASLMITRAPPEAIDRAKSYSYATFPTVAVGPAMGANPGPTVELVGQIGGVSRAVALQGQYAYLGVGPRLVVLDVADPSAPTVVGRTDVLSGPVRNVTVAGAYAYVAADQGGLRIVNISDPYHPAEVGFCATSPYTQDIVVSDSYAYLADLTSLRVLDVTDPANPVEIGSYVPQATTWAVRALRLDEHYAFVVDYQRLRIIDISDPASPAEVGSYEASDDLYALAIAGDYVYLAADSGLLVIEVSNPRQPTEVGACDAPTHPAGVEVSGNWAYIADRGAGKTAAIPGCLPVTAMPGISRKGLSTICCRISRPLSAMCSSACTTTTGRRPNLWHTRSAFACCWPCWNGQGRWTPS